MTQLDVIVQADGENGENGVQLNDKSTFKNNLHKDVQLNHGTVIS